ncbi:ropporin-1-like protein isoform X2 [Galleria mellonella]|uniref:Ropporin-1-like protein isoform X2 n=1 Tax=Galleria mellonella TaxID=7137 RepID=A0ABM3MC39_GALME|nr:ropporin-1-like protein isoform X2 [Galleria mellonella]
MPELIEQMYCSQQIVIPPKFPYILKRYCKAAIKTQPYDLLRWSYEYFKALAEHREPPVKLRLEYPVYSTEGGLTRGCLKVLANQLSGMSEVPLPVLKNAWQGFCLDPHELKRVLCLCEVYLREETVPFLHFIAVAGGLLTKTLTHTMILLCETLTKEPDGGSAAIPVNEFLTMYKFLAKMDASKDVKYFNGYKEGETPQIESYVEEEQSEPPVDEENDSLSDDYWQDTRDLQKLTLINDHVARSRGLSVKLNMPIVGKIERSPSIERAGQIERENYLRERKGCFVL